MSERSSIRGREIAAGLAVASVGALAFFSGNTSKDSDGPKHAALGLHVSVHKISKPPKIARIHGLEVGGKLTDVPVLRPNRSTNGDFKYGPPGKGNTKDLVAIYSRRLDSLMSRQDQTPAEREADKSTEMAFLLTSFPGGILESLVAFDPKTDKVLEVYPGNVLPTEGHGPLYRNVYPPAQVGFTIEVEPFKTDNGFGVDLHVDGLPQPVPGQDS